MPQMSPTMWTSLMIMFIMILMMINMSIYFNKNYLTKKSMNSKITKKMNWTW